MSADRFGYEHLPAYERAAEVDAIIKATVEMAARKPADYRHGSNCGVLSVAICAGVSFETAWNACRMRHGSRGGTTHAQREVALTALGIKHETKVLYRTKTVRVFARDWTVPGATYMLRVRGHVVTLRDGIVIDTTGVAPAVLHSYANARVTRATRIL